MGVAYQTANIVYRVVVSEKSAGHQGDVLYGVEGCDGSSIVQIFGLSHDCERITNLVDNMNKSQFELGLLNDVIEVFLSEICATE